MKLLTIAAAAALAMFSVQTTAHKAGNHHTHSHSHVPDVLAPYRRVGDVQALPVKAFNVTDYVLTPGSRFAYQQARNLQYLTAFNLTDLTVSARTN